MIAGILMVTDGMFPQCGGGYKPFNWEASLGCGHACRWRWKRIESFRTVWSVNSKHTDQVGADGGYYFTYFLMTMFYQQHGYPQSSGSYRDAKCNTDRVGPKPFLFAVTLGASMCFFLHFSTPPNALVMPARTIYLYGLCKGRTTAVGDYYGHCHGAGILLCCFLFKLFIIYDADDVHYKPSDRNRPPDSDDPDGRNAGKPIGKGYTGSQRYHCEHYGHSRHTDGTIISV